ncbi:MAG: precorrin-8X methylmutase [Desulfomonilaceae bacterium]
MSNQYGDKGLPVQPIINDLYENPISAEEIERRSFEIIDREAPPHKFSDSEWQVVRRMIHTTADFQLMDMIRFSSTAIESSVRALKSGAKIFVDSNMIRSGLSLARLKQVCAKYSLLDIVCNVADPDIAATSKERRLPRSLFAVDKARPILGGCIAAFGNAPVALMELNRLIVEEGIKPSVVIGMPVGFVHVVESKDELMSLDVPYITITGRRGGSPLAVSAIHALCSLAMTVD